MTNMNDKPETKFLAHIRQDDSGKWHEHSLDEHLRGVAVMAADFAAEFNSSDWASTAGLWHDLGKYSTEFQQYIKSVSGYDAHIEAPGRVDHSTAGAIHAVRQFNQHGRILAYLIAGHHAGLPDWNTAETGGKALSIRLGVEQNHLLDRIPAQAIPQKNTTQAKPTTKPHGGADGLHLWLRMLFSCLVDADFLDTEAFMGGDKAATRSGYARRATASSSINPSGVAPAPRRGRGLKTFEVVSSTGAAPAALRLSHPKTGGQVAGYQGERNFS